MSDNREFDTVPPFDIHITVTSIGPIVEYRWREEDGDTSYCGRTFLSEPELIELTNKMELNLLLDKATGILGSKWRASNPPSAVPDLNTEKSHDGV